MFTGEGLAIGFDVGGTKIAGGIVGSRGEVVARLSPVPTPTTDQAEIVRTLCGAITRLRRAHPEIGAVGIGAAGLVNWPDGYVRYGPNSAFHQLPLRRLVSEATGLPTVVDNDANVAGLGEARHVGADHLAFLTVGTGVGAGLILNGVPFRGQTGIAAEVGHMIVDANGGAKCGCGNLGCLEAVASGTALTRYGREAAAADRDGMIARIAGGETNVTGLTVLEAAAAGDETARGLYGRVGYWLGVGIATLVNLLDFQRVVIGGGLAAAGEFVLRPAREAFSCSLFARDHRDPTSIVASSLGPDAGWIGAGRLALERQTGDAGGIVAVPPEPGPSPTPGV
jgi:glucokinase